MSQNDNSLKNLKPFKPGQSGNPKGKPPTPQDVRDARKLNAVQVSRIINKFLNMDMAWIKEVIDQSHTPALEYMIGKMLIECGKTGDFQRLNFIFDRCVGKVTEKMEVKMPKPTVIKLIGEDAVLVLGNSQEKENEDENV